MKKKPLMETQVVWKHLNVKVFMVSFCGEGPTSVYSQELMHTQYQNQNEHILCLPSIPVQKHSSQFFCETFSNDSIELLVLGMEMDGGEQ